MKRRDGITVRRTADTHRTGLTAFEWVQQIPGPDVHVEYCQKHGGGVHHLGVSVTDMNEAIKLMPAATT
jgi:hypothetical protein